MSVLPRKKRLLVGPFLKAGLSDYMVGAFDDFDTLTFGCWPGADIQVKGLPSLTNILDLLPENWFPDYFILWRPEYGYIPTGLEDISCPSIMLVSDWYLAFSDCLEAAWRVDLTITGTRGLGVFKSAGFESVRAMPMLGYQPNFDGCFERPSSQRDIDVYLGGNPNWIIHRQREQIIGELLSLPGDVNLFHGPFVDRNSYNNLLGRSKIVVNQTVIGEINMKVYEVAASGACLFVEEDNLDIRDYLIPDKSVVLFNQDNLCEKVVYFLSHQKERESIAQAGQKAMAQFTYRDNFKSIVDHLDELSRQGKLQGNRPCSELSPEKRATGLLGYALRHNGGNVLSPVVLGQSQQLVSKNELLLTASAHYLAQLGFEEIENTNKTADGCVWSTKKILETFQSAYTNDPQYLPAAYCWARVAAAHFETTAALSLLEKVINLLVSGCAVPFSCADFFFMDPDTLYDFERIAWESLEKGQHLDDGLRLLLLEDVLVISAKLALSKDDDELAEVLLKLAIEQYAQGGRARPVLAELMRKQFQWEQGAIVWREHLLARPLSLIAYEGLMELAELCDAVNVTDNEKRTHQRILNLLQK